MYMYQYTSMNTIIVYKHVPIQKKHDIAIKMYTDYEAINRIGKGENQRDKDLGQGVGREVTQKVS